MTFDWACCQSSGKVESGTKVTRYLPNGGSGDADLPAACGNRAEALVDGSPPGRTGLGTVGVGGGLAHSGADAGADRGSARSAVVVAGPGMAFSRAIRRSCATTATPIAKNRRRHLNHNTQESLLFHEADIY